MSSLPLYISRDLHYDWLIALEFGRVLDGQPADHLLPVGDEAAFVLDGAGGEIVGFSVMGLSQLDASADDLKELWHGPRFDAPLFGLRGAHAGEVVLAAQAMLLEESTTNRRYFDMATGQEGEEAVASWRACLECGDSMAHYGLGYTLLELGRTREAYRHLRAYVETARWNAWAWCWLGRACLELGDHDEGRDALLRALALEDEEDETDARELLDSHDYDQRQ